MEGPDKVWVLFQHTDADGNPTCELLKVFGNTEAALATYLKMTKDPEGSEARNEGRDAIVNGEEVDFTAAEGGEHFLQRVAFVGPMGGGRRRRKTIRRRR